MFNYLSNGIRRYLHKVTWVRWDSWQRYYQDKDEDTSGTQSTWEKETISLFCFWKRGQKCGEERGKRRGQERNHPAKWEEYRARRLGAGTESPLEEPSVKVMAYADQNTKMDFRDQTCLPFTTLEIISKVFHFHT